MSLTTAILFADVNKRFKFSTDDAESILDVVVSGMRRKSHRKEQVLWAVRDVSFSIRPGESVALVGRNGSGKSTILKLASGIFRPTSGRVEVRGRLSALLELGAGFHPDLTGQENIKLNASMLGLSNSEISTVYDEIVEFSELGDFINMPVKHYSSGMYMRLGFSVAVHISPDVLLIDEILAVGDQSFQDKSIEKLHELKELGTTVVFVSHNPSTVVALCERALWIEDGRVAADGPSDHIVGDYLARQETERKGRKPLTTRGGPVTRDVELLGLRLLDVAGQAQSDYQAGQSMTIEVDYLAHRSVGRVAFDLSFQHEDGAYVGGPGGSLDEPGAAVEEGQGTLRCRIASVPLLPAAYYVTATIYDGVSQAVLDSRERCASFRIVPDQTISQAAPVRMPATWETFSRAAEPGTKSLERSSQGTGGSKGDSISTSDKR